MKIMQQLPLTRSVLKRQAMLERAQQAERTRPFTLRHIAPRTHGIYRINPSCFRAIDARIPITISISHHTHDIATKVVNR